MDALATIQRLASGAFIDKLAAALAETSQQVVESGNPGAVKVTLKISKSGEFMAEPMVIVIENITQVKPKNAAIGTFYFAVDGELYQSDPRQAPLVEMHEVTRTAPEVHRARDEKVTG